MIFKKIFNNILLDANNISDLRRIYIGDLYKTGYGAYEDGGYVFIHRIDKNNPDSSYEQDIISLFHEIGHHLNVKFDRGTFIYKSGFNQQLKDIEQPINMIKEEHMAWQNAYKLLWNSSHITNYYKILMSINMFTHSIECLFTYYKCSFERNILGVIGRGRQ